MTDWSEVARRSAATRRARYTPEEIFEQQRKAAYTAAANHAAGYTPEERREARKVRLKSRRGFHDWSEAGRRGWETRRAHNLAYVHGRSRSREYRTWVGIRARCGVTGGGRDNAAYVARGMLDEWKPSNSFPIFFDYLLATIGPHPGGPGWSIDRIDNDLGYFPGNIRWLRMQENARYGGRVGGRPRTGVREETVRRYEAIAAAVDAGESQRDVVTRFGVHIGLVGKARKWLRDRAETAATAGADATGAVVETAPRAGEGGEGRSRAQ